MSVKDWPVDKAGKLSGMDRLYARPDVVRMAWAIPALVSHAWNAVNAPIGQWAYSVTFASTAFSSSANFFSKGAKAGVAIWAISSVLGLAM